MQPPSSPQIRAVAAVSYIHHTCNWYLAITSNVGSNPICTTMKKTRVQSKRFPRKLKKEIKQMFGEKRYKGLLKSQQFVSPRIIAYMPTDGSKKWLNRFEGWNIFFMIED